MRRSAASILAAILAVLAIPAPAVALEPGNGVPPGFLKAKPPASEKAPTSTASSQTNPNASTTTRTGTTPTAGGTTTAPAKTSTQTGTSSTESPSAVSKEIEALTRGVVAKPVKKSHGSSKLSGAAILLAVLGGLLAIACLLWAITRFAVLEPHWLLALRHAIAEAGFRISGVWSEFADWARLGH